MELLFIIKEPTGKISEISAGSEQLSPAGLKGIILFFL
jgi:hypothetical protein